MSSINLLRVAKFFLTIFYRLVNIKQGGETVNFLEKLDFLMQQKGLNKNTLSQACGVPYTTIDSFYKKGFEGVKLSTAQKIADYFETSLDYLFREDINDVSYATDELYSDSESKMRDYYKSLNDTGKEKLLDIADDMLKSGKYSFKSKNSPQKVKVFQAARSDDHVAPKIVLMDKSELDILRNTESVTSADDL